MKKINKLLLLLATLTFFACNVNEIPNQNNNQNNYQNNDREITIYGNVIDRASGSPLYNVMIELFKHYENSNKDDKVLGSTVTGNDGNYEFTVALNDMESEDSDDYTYYVRASKDKYSTSAYKLNLSNVDRSNRIKVDFQITSASIFYKGTVKDKQGNALVDAKVKARYYSANASEENVRDYGKAIGTTVITDYNGKYTFEVPIPTDEKYLPQWQYLIYVEKDGYATAEHFVNQNTEDMGRTITLNFAMKTIEEQDKEDAKKDNVTIYGKVTDINGKPISNAFIKDYLGSSYGSHTILCSTIQTDAQGKYEILSPLVYSVGMSTYTYHSYVCEAEDFCTAEQYLRTTKNDAGNSYNFDFMLKKR